MSITKEEALRYLDYAPETGVFRWRIRSGPRGNPGSVAGNWKASGYVEIRLRGKIYKAHRLAWLCAYGAWPDLPVDHINQNKSDNRIANLRLATVGQNCCNKGARRDSKSGVKGVCWYKKLGRWVAQIEHRGEPYHLGYFHSIDEAAAAYAEAAKRLHGEFAST